MTDDRPKTAVSRRPRRKSRWRTRLLLMAISTLLTLLLAEGLVRVLRPGFPGFAVPQVEHRVREGLGFEMTPHQKAFTFAEPVSVNSMGFRGPEQPEIKNPFTIRIICLGDSLTFGVGVGDDDCYPRQLERMLNDRLTKPWKAEVVNAGVQRYFTYQEIDQFRLYAEQWQADIVLLGMYPNDYGRRPTESYVREYEKAREQAATKIRHRAPAVYLLLKRSALVTTVKDAYFAMKRSDSSPQQRLLRGEPTASDKEVYQEMTANLATFKDLADQFGAYCLVHSIPSRLQITRKLPNSLFPRMIQADCERLGLAYVDAFPRFSKSATNGDDPYLAWDNHLSPLGNRIVAENLRDALTPQLEQIVAAKGPD